MTLIYSAKKNKKLKFTTLQRHKHVKKPLHNVQHRAISCMQRFCTWYFGYSFQIVWCGIF